MPRANFETGTKVCSKCRVEQVVENFSPSPKPYDGLHSQCKSCVRNKVADYLRRNPHYQTNWLRKNPRIRAANKGRHYKKHKVRILARIAEYRRNNPTHIKNLRRQRQYGLSPEDTLSINKSQDGKCPGCLVDLIRVKKVCVDHNHTTNKVRGLLCSNCNLCLGQAKDSKVILKRLVNYLEACGE